METSSLLSSSTSSSKQRWAIIGIVSFLILLTFVAVAAILIINSHKVETSSSSSSNNIQTSKIVLNEFMFFSSNQKCWVEVWNNGNTESELNGAVIEMNEIKISISKDVLAADEYLLIEAQCPKATLPQDENSVYLMSVKFLNGGNLVDSLEWELKSWTDNWSFFRDNSVGQFSFLQTPTPTPGAKNLDDNKLSHVSAGSWKPGTFEIHIFNVGQGDSQLIIFPSGYTILIDLSESATTSTKTVAEVVAKIDAILGKRTIDVGIITHLHLDHLGYYGYGGFYALFEKYGFKFGKLIDRDAGKWVDSNNDGVCDPNTEIVWKYAGTFSTTATKWLCYATDPRNTKVYSVRQAAQLCSTTQIRPPDNAATVRIVSADALGAKLLNGELISKDRTKDPLPPSENDFSIGVSILFGEIEYATLGDLDGDYATSPNGYLYNDIEAVAAPRIGGVDIYRANHHGSSHSTNANFVNTLNPSVGLISCGADNSYGHPDQGVLNRLLAKGDVYLTNLCDKKKTYGRSRIANGDIKISSTNGRNFEVSAGGVTYTYTAKSKQNKKVTCIPS